MLSVTCQKNGSVGWQNLFLFNFSSLDIESPPSNLKDITFVTQVVVVVVLVDFVGFQ